MHKTQQLVKTTFCLRVKMPSKGSSFLRQLSSRENWNSSSSKRWNMKNNNNNNGYSSSGDGGYGKSLRKMEGFNMYGDESGSGFMMRKRVMVVVDNSSCAKHAMMWALTHLTNKGDLLTLLHIIPSSQTQTPSGHERDSSSPSYLANSLGSLCKACKPEVDVEALVIQGPKLATVISQVKKLEVSALVLGQKKSSPLINCLCGNSTEEFVDDCINNAECLTLGVKKQSRGMGGYLISTRWQKNFWLLA